MKKNQKFRTVVLAADNLYQQTAMSPEARTILENLHQPERLEQLYRENPVAFRQALEEALQHRPDSETLRVWHVRLTYRPERPGFWRHPALWKVLAIALGTALLVRLPLLWRAPDWYLPRFAPMWSLLALAAYFALGRSISRRLLLAGLVLTGLSALWVSLLPDETDTTVMALLHLPVLFWLYAGMVYLGGAWTLPENRCTFVRYSGALLITASLLALGGLVFSALTVSLFELVRPEAEEWYFQNIGLPGLAALPVVAAFAGELLRGRQEAFLELLARLFGPLFLAMISTFLVATLLGGKNPFLDRNFLIVFNGVLLLVLAMTVFLILLRERQRGVELQDYLNVALVALTLLIDAIALAAIFFRLTTFGLTPNRIVVLGANLLIFVHLAWIGRDYMRLLRGKADYTRLERTIGRYLPVYALWAMFVVFVLPPLFGFG